MLKPRTAQQSKTAAHLSYRRPFPVQTLPFTRMSSDKDQFSMASQRTPLGGRVKNHYKKWWWAHLLVFIAILLVIFLPLIFVGVPKIAQKQLNDAKLDIRSMQILNPGPNTLDIKLETAVSTNTAFKPTLDPFVAEIYLPNGSSGGKSFAYIPIPKQQPSNNALSVLSQTLTITDMAGFTDYVKLIMASNIINLGVRSNVTMHISGLPTQHLKFDKNITSQGFNKLSGFQFTNTSMSLAPSADGANFFGTAIIPNAANVTVEMGNVTHDLFVDGSHIGNSTLANLILHPGTNQAPLRAAINMTAIAPLLLKFTNLTIPIEARGRSVVRNGVELPYYAEALKATPLQIQTNLLDVLPGASGSGSGGSASNPLDLLKGLGA